MSDRTPRQEAWQAATAARRLRRKAERLLGRITGMPRRHRARFVGWVVVHPAAESGAARRPVRRRATREAPPIAPALRLRGRPSNPTALR